MEEEAEGEEEQGTGGDFDVISVTQEEDDDGGASTGIGNLVCISDTGAAS